MIRLALAQLRRRGWRYLSLFFAVFAAVGLTVATAAIVESLQFTVNGMFDKPYANAKYVATVRSSNPEEIDEALSNPNMQVAFDQQVTASIKKQGSLYETTYVHSIEDGPLQWREVQEGRLPHGPGEIAVVDDTPLGSQLELKVPGQNEDVPVTVVGKVEQSAQEQLIGSKSILADQQTTRDWGAARSADRSAPAAAPSAAQQAARSTSNSTASGELRIQSQESLQAVKQQLPNTSFTEVQTAKQHTAALANKYLSGRDQYFLLLTAFMFIVAVVAILVVFSSYSVLAAERQREFALLRAVGASSTQLLGSTAAEATVLGALAGALGIPAGLWAAQLAGRHADLLGVRVPLTEVSLNPKWLLAIFVASIVVSIISALPAARGAVTKPLVQTLTASSENPKATGLAALVIGAALTAGGGYGLTVVDTQPARRGLMLAIASSGTIVLGAVLLAAAIFPWLIFQLSRLLGALPFPTLQLGMAFVGRQRMRAGALIAIVLAGTALVSAVLHGQQQLEEYMLSKATNKGAVDVAVKAMDNSIEQPLVDALAHTPGVVASVAPVALPVEADSGVKDTVLALSTADGAPVLRGPVTGAQPGELVLGATSPLRNSLKDGSQANITVRDQPHTLTVRYSDGIEGFVDPAVTPEVPQISRPGVDTRLPRPAVLLRLQGGYSQPADSPVLAQLRNVAAGSDEQVSFQEAFTARENVAETASRVLTLSTLMSVVALLIAGVGVLNTVTLMVRERGRDLRLLGAIGVSALGRLGAQLIELLFLVIPAALLGSALGAVLGAWISSVVTKTAGLPLSPMLFDAHSLAVAGGATGIALVVGVYAMIAGSGRKQ